MQQTNFVAQPKRSRADGFLHQMLTYCISSFAQFFLRRFSPSILHFQSPDRRVPLLKIFVYFIDEICIFNCNRIPLPHAPSSMMLMSGASIYRVNFYPHTNSAGNPSAIVAAVPSHEPHGTIVCGYLSKWFFFRSRCVLYIVMHAISALAQLADEIWGSVQDRDGGYRYTLAWCTHRTPTAYLCRMQPIRDRLRHEIEATQLTLSHT